MTDAIALKHRRLSRDAQRRRRRNAILFTSLLRATVGTSHPIRGTVDASSGRVEFSHQGMPRRPAAEPTGRTRGRVAIAGGPAALPTPLNAPACEWRGPTNAVLIRVMDDGRT